MIAFNDKVIKRFRRTGLTNQQILSVQSAFDETLQTYKDEATKESFLYLMTIPLSYMVSDVWGSKEEAREKAPEYVKVMMGLYQSFVDGYTTLDELSAQIKDYADLDIMPLWEQIKNNKIEFADRSK